MYVNKNFSKKGQTNLQYIIIVFFYSFINFCWFVRIRINYMDPKMKDQHKNVSETQESSIRQIVINFSKVCGISIVINLLFLFIMLSLMHFYTEKNMIYIYSDKLSPHTVSSKFVSIGLDDIVLAEGFCGFNMSDGKLLKMIKYLQPAYLRIGGNLGDKLVFSPDNRTLPTDIGRNLLLYDENDNFVGGPNFTLTGSQWLELMKLADKAKVDVIFGLNVLIRFKNGSWDYRNAEELIRFSDERNLHLNWELGNEPDSFAHKFNESVNATQLAKDFKTLRNILNKYKMYKDSLLVGPDANRLPNQGAENYLKDFLKIAGSTINGITWHQYYLNGRTATPEDFLNVTVLNSLAQQINAVKCIAEKLNLRSTPLWLGETSSAYGGGAPNISDRFVASFCWLDKLGLSARLGVDVVVRQSIFRGNYALLDENYNPNPDWWVSILFKLLVGKNVIPSGSYTKKTVRLYTHCSRDLPFFDDSPTSITVFGINVDSQPAVVKIQGLPKPINNQKPMVYAFELTPDGSDLLSKKIRCNGKLLELLPNHDLPKFVPKVLKRKKCGLLMPPYSLVFWVIPDVKVEACGVFER